MINEKFLRTKNIKFYKVILTIINAISLVSVFILYYLMSQPNIINESLSEGDIKQVMAVITSTIGLGIVIIGFFFWTISVIYRNIYESRRVSNINLRLIGLGKGDLIKIYVLEFIKIFPFSLIIGIISYYIIINILNELYNLYRINTGIDNIILIFMYLFIILMVIVFTLIKLPSKNVIDEKRVDYQKEMKKKKISLKKLIIGLLMILAIYFFINSIQSRYRNLLKFLYFVPYLFLVGELIYIVDKLILRLVKRSRFNFLTLSVQLNFRNNKSKMMKFHFLVIGLVLFLGLNMLFTNVRFVAGNIVDENINFSHYEVFNLGTVNNRTLKENINTSTSIEATIGFSNVTISGINSKYFANVEDIYTFEQDILELKECFSNSYWPGIIMPDYYVSEEDIGSEVIVKYDGIEIPFILVSGYKSNDISKLNCYVSHGYLNKQLNLREGDFNRLYIFDGANYGANNEKISIVFKEDIKNNSINKAIKGTEDVEIVSLIVLVTSIIFFTNLIFLETQKDIIDMAKLRVMGFSRLQIYLVYIFNNFIVLTQTFLVAGGLSIEFAKIAAYTIIGDVYFDSPFILNFKSYILAFIILLVLTIMIILLRTIDILSNKHLKYIRNFEL